MSRARRHAWLLCWLLSAATALSFLDRQVLSVLAPTLMSHFGMTNTVYSRIVFAFQLSYTIMFSLGGVVVDRLGTRRGMAASLGLWSAASAAHAAVNGPWGLGGARLLLGLGEGGCFPAAMKGAVEWFPVDQRTLAIGIANGGSALGAVIAPPLTALAAARFGWRGAFLGTGMLGTAWLCAWLFATRRGVPESAVRTDRVSGASLPGLLRDRNVRLVLAARFLFDPVFYFYIFWIPQYLSRERGLSLAEIGAHYWVPFLVLGLSQMFCGRWTDAVVRRRSDPLRARLAFLLAAAALTPASWAAWLAPSAGWAVALMSLLMLAHGFWITNFLGLLSDLFPAQAIATVTGLTGTMGGIGGMLSSLAVGVIVDRLNFAPVFAVSGVLYPAAFLLLWQARRSRASAGLDRAAGFRQNDR
ncbi:MAG TPA: MFS transporter [Bryobacteraceae bacterium]|nr:MFS transporter [Bryobacteraceae bacterium]